MKGMDEGCFTKSSQVYILPVQIYPNERNDFDCSKVKAAQIAQKKCITRTTTKKKTKISFYIHIKSVNPIGEKFY